MSIPILYHGTDARIIAMSDNERHAYFNVCTEVKDYLWSIFKPYYENEMVETIIHGYKAFVQHLKIERYRDYIIEHSDEITWRNLYEKLMMCDSNERGSQLYQYGYLYLTGDMNKAKRYAFNSFAGGEIGSIAYRLIQGAEILGWIDNEDIKKGIDTIKTFAEAKATPIVIPVSDLDINYLFGEKGNPIVCQEEWYFKGGNFRYTKEYTLSLEKAIYIE